MCTQKCHVNLRHVRMIKIYRENFLQARIFCTRWHEIWFIFCVPFCFKSGRRERKCTWKMPLIYSRSNLRNKMICANYSSNREFNLPKSVDCEVQNILNIFKFCSFQTRFLLRIFNWIFFTRVHQREPLCMLHTIPSIIVSNKTTNWWIVLSIECRIWFQIALKSGLKKNS